MIREWAMFILGETMRDSIVWYRSFMEAVEELPAEDFKRCVMTILKYGLDGEIPQTNGIERTIYIMAKPQLDKNYQKWVNGKSGGRPKNQTEEEPNDNQSKTKNKPKNNQMETKPQPNVNVNANVNENEYDDYDTDLKKFLQLYPNVSVDVCGTGELSLIDFSEML